MNWAGARGLVSKLAKPEQQGTINDVLLVCWSLFIHSFISSRCSFFHHLLPGSHCSGPFRCLLASHLPPHSQTQHEARDDFHIHGCSWVLPSTYCIVSITAHDVEFTLCKPIMAIPMSIFTVESIWSLHSNSQAY